MKAAFSHLIWLTPAQLIMLRLAVAIVLVLVCLSFFWLRTYHHQMHVSHRLLHHISEASQQILSEWVNLKKLEPLSSLCCQQGVEPIFETGFEFSNWVLFGVVIQGKERFAWVKNVETGHFIELKVGQKIAKHNARVIDIRADGLRLESLENAQQFASLQLESDN